MNLGKMYIRDPRELPFLREQAKMILALADSASRGVSVREDDDFGFMAMQFLYKQVQHAEALLMLEPRRDAGLIARTMIDGLYQLLWTTHDAETRARRWRSFSIIHDWRLIQGKHAGRRGNHQAKRACSEDVRTYSSTPKAEAGSG